LASLPDNLPRCEEKAKKEFIFAENGGKKRALPNNMAQVGCYEASKIVASYLTTAPKIKSNDKAFFGRCPTFLQLGNGALSYSVIRQEYLGNL